MKTIKELRDDFNKIPIFHRDDNISNKAIAKFIGDIQLDSAKAGMRLTAKYVKSLILEKAIIRKSTTLTLDELKDL